MYESRECKCLNVECENFAVHFVFVNLLHNFAWTLLCPVSGMFHRRLGVV